MDCRQARQREDSYLSVLMVDHNVMRLHITVHDALAVAEIQRLEELRNVETNIEVVELGVQASKVGIVHELEDERGRLALQALHVSNGFSPSVGRTPSGIMALSGTWARKGRLEGGGVVGFEKSDL